MNQTRFSINDQSFNMGSEKPFAHLCRSRFVVWRGMKPKVGMPVREKCYLEKTLMLLCADGWRNCGRGVREVGLY